MNAYKVEYWVCSERGIQHDTEEEAIDCCTPEEEEKKVNG